VSAWASAARRSSRGERSQNRRDQLRHPGAAGLREGACILWFCGSERTRGRGGQQGQGGRTECTGGEEAIGSERVAGLLRSAGTATA
jgi:hypothetical protein